MVLACILIAGCTKTEIANRAIEVRPVENVHLQLSGSSTVGPLVAEIGKRYEQLHNHVRIDVQTGGSSRGIADAKNGLADIGITDFDRNLELEGDLKMRLSVRLTAFAVTLGAAFLLQSCGRFS